MSPEHQANGRPSEDRDYQAEEPQLIYPPKQAQKGRGANSNITGRFESQTSERVDDGWWHDPDEINPTPAGRTQVTEELAKSLINRNQSPDLPFSLSINPYRGCEHGCIYCFARPTHAYLGLSPGLDFETRLYAKVNAPELLRQELASPSHTPSPIAMGVNTDAYQPCERHYRITRQLLEILWECKHPVGLISKSSLIERDMDLLAPMASQNLAVVCITLTTLDHQLSRRLEPRAASPSRRLQTIHRLTEAGIPVAVNLAPIIPFITEQEMEKLLTAAAEAGATGAGYTVLRLPWELSPLFREWLEVHFPERAERVMHRLQDMRGGKDYDARFSLRMKGEGVWADLIHQRFQKASSRLGFNRSGRFRHLDISQFRRPLVVPPKPRSQGQMDFFQ